MPSNGLPVYGQPFDHLRQALSLALLPVQILIVGGLTEQLVDLGVGGQQIICIENLTIIHHILERRCAEVLVHQRTVVGQDGVQQIRLVVGEQILVGVHDVAKFEVTIQNRVVLRIANRPWCGQWRGGKARRVADRWQVLSGKLNGIRFRLFLVREELARKEKSNRMSKWCNQRVKEKAKKIN